MANGDLLLNEFGERILTATGEQIASNGVDDSACCCGEDDPAACCGLDPTPSGWRVTLADIIQCTTCWDGYGLYNLDIVGDPNGVYDVDVRVGNCEWQKAFPIYSGTVYFPTFGGVGGSVSTCEDVSGTFTASLLITVNFSGVFATMRFDTFTPAAPGNPGPTPGDFTSGSVAAGVLFDCVSTVGPFANTKPEPDCVNPETGADPAGGGFVDEISPLP